MKDYMKGSNNIKNNDNKPNVKLIKGEFGGKELFITKLKDIQEYLKLNPAKHITNKKRKCKYCDEDISGYIYNLKKFVWEDNIIHNITKHKMKPINEFMEFIYKYKLVCSSELELKCKRMKINKLDNSYIELNKNQILILDALLKHGGYTKKYGDGGKYDYKYSEHAGLIDFNGVSVDKIIVYGNTTRVDRGDEEIYLPNELPEAFKYEYIFHTHPPTPKPGGRVKEGILYEFPSVGDLLHFIEHFNDGNVIGSLVMTPEGLYNIRKLTMTKTKIKIDEDGFFDEIRRAFFSMQDNSIKKYGEKFSMYTYYSVIAQDMDFLKYMNEKLEKYNLKIDFYPRIKDTKGVWCVDTVFLPIFNK